jgi:hypothetical protein
MTLEDKVHAFRLHLFRRAQELGNVSAACRELGVSRSLYYQLRKRFVDYGPDGLHPKRHRGRPGRPTQLDATVERQVIALALSWPSWGPQQLSDQLAMRGIRVARSTAYRALRRHGLGTRRERLGILERHSARRAGLLTERTRRAIQKARPTASRSHAEAEEPGELVCLDCFYIGKLKGVGKVWQITACDVASSYGPHRERVPENGCPPRTGARTGATHPSPRTGAPENGCHPPVTDLRGSVGPEVARGDPRPPPIAPLAPQEITSTPNAKAPESNGIPGLLRRSPARLILERETGLEPATLSLGS